jgi:hypothetical protein
LKDHPRLTVEYLVISGAWDDLIEEAILPSGPQSVGPKIKVAHYPEAPSPWRTGSFLTASVLRPPGGFLGVKT